MTCSHGFEASTVIQSHLSLNVSRDTDVGAKRGSHLLSISQKQSSQEREKSLREREMWIEKK